MTRIALEIKRISSPLKRAFTISRGSKTHAETVQVTLHKSGKTGRGECVPYARYGESVESVIAEIETIRDKIEDGLTKEALLTELPPGAARCAVDCAMWDLEAKLTGTPVWERAELPEPQALKTAITVSLDTPAEMAKAAKTTPSDILKLKIGGPEDLDRVEAVHAARPLAQLILDANEALPPENLQHICETVADLGAVLIEQPLPAGDDFALTQRPGPVAICADESVHTSDDIQSLAKRYDAINIKLDKSGGLTEALRMMRAANRAGLNTMVGCMVAGSLSMAPALLLGGLADFIDLDGPLWLSDDIKNGLIYSEAGFISPPSSQLWG